MCVCVDGCATSALTSPRSPPPSASPVSHGCGSHCRDLGHNALEVVQRDTFERLRALKHLLLGHNQVSLIHGGAFSQLNSLTVL